MKMFFSVPYFYKKVDTAYFTTSLILEGRTRIGMHSDRKHSNNLHQWYPPFYSIVRIRLLVLDGINFLISSTKQGIISTIK